ncbi:MAG: glycosyltransferase family 29 protein [Limnospira sp. PMC 737.11]|nr:glycosyltransferase family 29 protein [Limnospira sp. PMC 737.11]
MGDSFGIFLVWGVSKLVSDLDRGNQLLRSGKLEEAVAAYQKAIALHPHFHWSHYKLGETLGKLGRLQEAVVAYQKAVELNPSSSSSSNLGRALYYQGQSLEEEGKWEEAVKQYGSALNLAFDPTEVNPHLRNLITCNTKEAEVRQHLGTGLSKLSLYEEAVIELRKALELNPISVEVQRQLKSALNHLGLPMDSHKIIIKQLEFDQYLQDYLAGKSVAVVGSSARLLEKKYGSCIDSHDIVVRFNGADIRGFEVHAGSKTSMRFALANFTKQPNMLEFFKSLEEDSIFITLKKNIDSIVLNKKMIVANFQFHMRAFSIIDNILGTEYRNEYRMPVRTGLATLLHLIHAGKHIKRISVFGMERKVRKEGKIHFFDEPELAKMELLNSSLHTKSHIPLEEEMEIFNQILDRVDLVSYEPETI